jgi:hypothetical protein
MAIQFPSNPSLNDTVSQAGRNYVWNGTSWDAVPNAVSFNDLASTPNSLIGYGISDSDVGGYLSVQGQSYFNGDVKLNNDLYVTGAAYFSPHTIYIGGSSISDDPTDGITIGGAGLSVEGDLTVQGVTIANYITNEISQSSEADTAFTHDGSLYPGHIKTKDDALEYVLFSAQSLDNRMIEHFNDGITGHQFEYEFRLVATARKGGLASVSDSSNLYLSGTTANISASALPGYSFDHWSGENLADSFSSTTTVTMNGERLVSAYFTKT